MRKPITEIKPSPANPRTIRDDRFAKLVQSIKDFPEMLEKRPLVCVTDTDGKYVVLGGNMRLKAAKAAGLKTLPITLADEWTAEQRAQFVIKDNVGFGDWDWGALRADWDVEQLDAWGLEVPEFEVEAEAQEDDYEMPLEKLIVEIECDSEREQEKVFTDMTKKGFKCRVLTL